jgi:hypothetical protein
MSFSVVGIIPIHRSTIVYLESRRALDLIRKQGHRTLVGHWDNIPLKNVPKSRRFIVGGAFAEMAGCLQSLSDHISDHSRSAFK